MPAKTILGWDIGGAYLKGARLEEGEAVTATVQLPCPLWQGLDCLRKGLGHARSELGEAPLSAVTMTGELVDAFPNRREGVRALVETVRKELPGTEQWIYAGSEGFLAPSTATHRARAVASANWHASATLTATMFGEGLLVDIGSTTTDLVPFTKGSPCPHGSDDGSRLAADELVYSGTGRTPVFALTDWIPFAGEWNRLMAEAFATTADIYRITGEGSNGADRLPTPDGAGKSPEESARRLARMIGRDVEDAPWSAWHQLATYLADCQLAQLHAAAARILSRDGIGGKTPVVVAGTGHFLARRLVRRLERPLRDLEAVLDPGSATQPGEQAPAVAVAWLLAQHLGKQTETTGSER